MELMDYTAQYKSKTPESAKLFARSAELHAGGISHNIRFFEPYPFVSRRACGKSLEDVDGNRYTDYWMGHWSLILGHAPASVSRALESQVRDGWMYGTVNEQTLKLSDTISGAVPAAEKIRYTASGTEATAYAVRLARAYTKRKVIAKIDGGWHGYGSDLLKAVNWPFDAAESGGLVGEDAVVSIPYNDLAGSLEILARHRDDLAGVIIEPLLGNRCTPADADYLRGIQEFAHSAGALFMLDEIVTGFRLRFGCLYETMGLDPDIITLGKIIGGGLAVGAFCGKDHIMRLAGMPEKGSQRAYVGGGTFSASPASMTAGYETLRDLRSGAAYSKMGSLGEMVRRGLHRAFDGRAAVTGAGSLFMVHFGRDGHRIAEAVDASKSDMALLRRYHFKMIAVDGIFLLPGKMGALSTAHTVTDADALVQASQKFAQEMPQHRTGNAF